MANPKVWPCESCGRRLGYVETLADGRGVCRIKYKDLFVEIIGGVGGRITENCTRCGTANTINDDAPLEAVTNQRGNN